MSQAATTWQSLKPRKDLVLAGPIMPHPMTPMVMRSCAGTRRARAKGLAENAAVAAADWMNLRRVMAESKKGAFIGAPENRLNDVGENDNALVCAFPPMTASWMGHPATVLRMQHAFGQAR